MAPAPINSHASCAVFVCCALQADRSIESLFAELVSNGILQQCPHVHVRDYLGSSSFMAATLEKANIIPDPSMAQVGAVRARAVGARSLGEGGGTRGPVKQSVGLRAKLCSMFPYAGC